jgi:hypothetical protein
MKDVKSQEKFIQTTIKDYKLFVLATIYSTTLFDSLCARFVCISMDTLATEDVIISNRICHPVRGIKYNRATHYSIIILNDSIQG